MANKLKVGDVWRKNGPCDWVKILRIQMPGYPDYDGAAPGCSVVFTNIRGNWQRNSFFIVAHSAKEFQDKMTAQFRFKEKRND